MRQVLKFLNIRTIDFQCLTFQFLHSEFHSIWKTYFDFFTFFFPEWHSHQKRLFNFFSFDVIRSVHKSENNFHLDLFFWPKVHARSNAFSTFFLQKSQKSFFVTKSQKKFSCSAKKLQRKKAPKPFCRIFKLPLIRK